MIVLVAAMGRNRVIGVDGGLPWRLPADLRRFKALTIGKPLIVGRATYDSIGRVLPERPNIVISRQPGLTIDGAEVASSPGHALVLALRHDPDVIVVAGGGTIYRQYMPMASRIELTVVGMEPAGDTTFPELAGDWNMANENRSADQGIELTYQTWVRRTEEPALS